MKDNHVRILTIFGIIAIISVFLVQIFWVKQAFDISESQFEQNVTVALRQVAEKIAIKNKTNFHHKNPVIKINPRHYVVEVRSEIDASLLDHYIVSTFDYFNIDQDVEYGIYGCDTKEMVYCNYIQKSKPQKEVTVTDLPKFEGLDYYFTVTFPHYPIVSLNNIPMWIVTSLVLIIVVLFIMYALFVVFSQKSVTRVQREFINNMTHEFKTPISTISVIQQVISDPEIVKTPQRLATYTQIIGDEISRLNDQVERVLHISRLEKRQVEMHIEDIDVHEVIDKVVFNLTHADFEKEINISQNLKAGNSLIQADRIHFTNVVCNIIENGIKYSQGTAEIKVSTENEGSEIFLTVADNGEGINKKEVKKIFDKFYRISTGDTHNVKGFGLGLFYVKKIADAHQWKISVASEPGIGTSFVISIHQKK
ncbi:MAG: HAMP domain-containing histidine kinase [Saprospiraceae bacterium]|nr:HAMP domain-containing histidine kinase [Saprospiraceae bacterium]